MEASAGAKPETELQPVQSSADRMSGKPRAINDSAYCVNVSGDDSFDIEKNAGEGDYSKAQYQNNSSTNQSAIRLMSLMVSGGVVGVNACIAALLVFSESNAVLAGSVSAASGAGKTGKYALTVHSNMDFGQVMTANGMLSAGAGGANVSAAGTYFGGKSKAAIDGAGTIQNIDGNIRVYTTGITRAIGAAASGAGGAVGVNATFAMAINRSNAETYIGRSVTMYVPTSNVELFHNITAEARAYNIAVSAGAAAVNASAVLVINNFQAHTWIGHVSGTSVPATNGTLTADTVTVSANAKTVTEAVGISASAGAIACNGLVALAFNTTGNKASAAQKNITANKLTVTSVIDGDTTVLATSLAAGLAGVGAGAIVATAISEADNTAHLDLSNCSMDIDQIFVNAGTAEKPNDNQALVFWCLRYRRQHRSCSEYRHRQEFRLQQSPGHRQQQRQPPR